MSAHNTANAYGWVAKTFHWSMALLIIGMLALGLYMSDLEPTPFKFDLYWWHKSVGSLILALVACRLLWRAITPRPSPLPMPRWQRIASKATHLALYATMIAMPMTGWLMSDAYGFPVSVFGWFTLPALVAPDKEMAHFFYEMHELGMLAFFALIGIHTAAALKHHFLDKDATLKRMLP